MNFLRYLNKFIGSLVLLALLIVAVTFAVSNRTMITVNLWPFPVEASFQLGATVLTALALGLIAGTSLMAFSRYKVHCQARSSQKRVVKLEKITREASATLPISNASPPAPAPRRALRGQ